MALYLIGIDIGTSGCKVILFDRNFQHIKFAQQSYIVDSPGQGRVELNPDEVWKAVISSLNQVLGEVERHDRQGNHFYLSFSILGDGLIITDREGKLLYPAILSSDTRSSQYARRIVKDLGEDYLIGITGRSPHPMAVLPRILWWKDYDSNTSIDNVIFHDFQSWLMSKADLPSMTDYSLASGTLLFDIKEYKWSEELLNYAGLRKNNLPAFRQAGTWSGRAGKAFKQQAGFSSQDEVDIVVGAMDQACAVLGSGNTIPGDSVCSMGTNECITFILEPDTDVFQLNKLGMYKMPGAITGQYISLIIIVNAGGSLKWFVNNFAKKEKEDSEKAGHSVFKYLLDNINGNEKLFFLPHLTGGGTPWMDPHSHGCLVGLTLGADVNNVANAIIEGVTFELKANINRLREINIPFNAMKVVGGGARSDRWLQIKANILNSTTIRLANNEAGCLGAAILAGYYAGIIDDPSTVAKEAVREKDVFEPTNEGVAKYRRKFLIYSQIYPALKNINHLISEYTVS